MSTIFLGFRRHEATLEQLQKEVGPGWSDLISRLVNKLFALGWDGSVLQCKEKFGGLRFYIGTVSQDVPIEAAEGIEKLVRAAEAESYSICEECGAPGVARIGGWIKTLCDTHANGRGPHPDM